MSREMTVLLTEGMYSWMCTWLSYAIEAAGGYNGLARGVEGDMDMNKNELVLFSGIRAEVVNILATMSLEKLKEERI
jgi:hypothetical protein